MHVHLLLLEHAHTAMLDMGAARRGSGDGAVRRAAVGKEQKPTAVISVFADADYRFGVGPLRIRIDHVDWGHPRQHDGEDWYEVGGIEMSKDGREIGRRQALVKGSRLQSLRPRT
jgi:hypothetical protein